jgi:hypothetical protein
MTPAAMERAGRLVVDGQRAASAGEDVVLSRDSATNQIVRSTSHGLHHDMPAVACHRVDAEEHASTRRHRIRSRQVCRSRPGIEGAGR